MPSRKNSLEDRPRPASAPSTYDEPNEIASKFLPRNLGNVTLSDKMITCENHVERLIEQRFIAPVFTGDVSDLKTMITERLKAATEPAPICTDLRHGKVLASTVAEALLKLLQGTNPKVLISVVLLNEKDHLFSSQIDRIITEAKNPSRKTFRALSDLLSWIKPHLSAAELQRALAFYSTPWKQH